jgi:tetratricopeptide (TPR) repeat protein
MKTDPILYKAVRLARAGNYDGAIRTLEPEVNRYYGSFRYYYLLGVSYLHTGESSNALTYFRLAHEAKTRDPMPLLGLAVLYLKRGKTDQAVDFYLEAQELDEQNKTAKKALKVIRKYAGADTFRDWLESGKISSLFPPLPSAGFSLRMVLIPCAVLAAALLISWGVLVKIRMLPNPLYPRGNRGRAAEFSLSREERSAPVEPGGSYRYTLTREEAVDAYDKAHSLFTTFHDEAAKINLNRVLESNASEGLKNKARILLTFMEVPGFDNFKRGDNVSFDEVEQDPPLYRDVYVIWRGKAANVEINGNTTSFKLLVDYDTGVILKGPVMVIFDRPVQVITDRPLEVLGKIVPSPQGETIRLEGGAIHQSVSLEN